MDFDPALFSNPHTWAFLIGFPAGAALAVLSVLSGRTRDPEKTRRAKPTKIFLLLTISTACAAGSVFHVSPARLVSGGVPAFLAAVVVAAFLALRFKKTAGFLALAVAIIFAGVSRAALSGWTRLDRPEAFAELSPLSAGTDFQELNARIGPLIETVSVPLEARDAVKAAFISVDEAYFMLGASQFARVEAIGGWSPRPAGGGAEFLRLFLLLPGIGSTRADFPLPKLAPIGRVKLQIKPDRSLELVDRY